MGYLVLANVVMVVHFCFLTYTVLGGFLAWRWPRTFWVHGGIVLWGAAASIVTIPCPLTNLENWLLHKGGEDGVGGGGFIQARIEGVLFPESWAVPVRIAVFVLVAVSWAGFFRRRRRRSPRRESAPVRVEDWAGSDIPDVMDQELADAIEVGRSKADRDNPGPTVDYFRDLLERFPGNRFALYEYGGALDTAGRETEAAEVYEQAFAAGLDGDTLRKCLIQYGSTLRNLSRHEEAVAALTRATREFPESDSARLFLALTLTGAGRSQEAVAELINLAMDRLEDTDAHRYERSLRGYAAALAESGRG